MSYVLLQKFKSMKKLLTAALIISLFGCEEENKGYSISGSVENIEDGKMIVVSELDLMNQPIEKDSVVIKDGKFSLDLPEVEQPNLAFLTVKGLNGNVMYISENENINFEIYKDSLGASKVSGGKENRLFYEYLNHLKDLNKKVTQVRMDMRREMTTTRDSASMAKLIAEEDALREGDIAFKKKIITENQDSFVSVLVLTDMQSMGVPAGELKKYFEDLSDPVKNTSLAQALKLGLDKQSAVEIGSKAPGFSGPNPQGEEIALKDVMGKVTLVDFWAAWCKPCRDENPNIVKVYDKYHDQGFNVVGVSLDREGQRDRWIQAIKDDKLTWPQISHLQFWQEPIAQLYGVRAIPAQFILNEEGVIVAKNLRGQDLEDKVKELLEEQ